MLKSFSRFLLILLGLGLASPGVAALNAADKSDVDRVETYLNSITALRARFLQVAPDSSTSEGTLSLLRPGHLRLDYDPPSQMMLLADKDWLLYLDKDLGEPYPVDVDSTPAALLIKPHLKLDGDGLAVSSVVHKPGLLEITLFKQSDPNQGKITLIFTEAPFQLKQWHVIDQQGQMTSVSLYETHFDAKFDKDWFVYKDKTGSPWDHQK